MLMVNKRVKFKKSYKKFKINKSSNAKLLYKLQYKPGFLSKVKKIVDDIPVFKSQLLLHNEKLPIKNNYTNKFVFSTAIIGKSLKSFQSINKKNIANKTFKPIKTGRLVLINKNPVLNPKLSKFIITTKRAITALEQDKKNILFNYFHFYKVFKELNEELAGVKNIRYKANNFTGLYTLLKSFLNKKRKFKNFPIKKVVKTFKKVFNKRRVTASELLQKELIRKSLNQSKDDLRQDYFIQITNLLNSGKQITKYIFTLTIAQLISSNVYLGNNSAYISSAIKPFLLGRRNGFYIINLSFTYIQFKVLINLIIGIVAKRGKILIVNEKDLFNLNLVLNYKNIFYCDKG